MLTGFLGSLIISCRPTKDCLLRLRFREREVLRATFNSRRAPESWQATAKCYYSHSTRSRG